MNEKFWDILAFCHQVSLLMVSEIRKRASDQSTEAASCAIVKFLEIENCEESSNGWMLLTTLNLLAAGDATLIQVCCILNSVFLLRFFLAQFFVNFLRLVFYYCFVLTVFLLTLYQYIYIVIYYFLYLFFYILVYFMK